jgi:uncharacterized membrane protein
MNATTISEAVVLGGLTGMRSTAGAATLAFRHHGWAPRVAAMMAAGEMVADKMPAVGDRIAPLPLAGRALMGAIVGGTVVRRAGYNAAIGVVIGGAAAVIAAHLAYRVRARLPVSNAVGGVLEDAFVMGVSALFASPSRARRQTSRRR